MTGSQRRRDVIVAGHHGALEVVLAHAADDDPGVREAVLGALDRLDQLADERIVAALADPAPVVRRRAAELAGGRRQISLSAALADSDATVVEVAAWACGEQEHVSDQVLDVLITLATDHDEPLVREAAAAALGAIGDERGVPAIIRACADKPHVRRRAVLALAPFEGAEVEAAIDRALADRDWQVRQSAEDLRRATGEIDLA